MVPFPGDQLAIGKETGRRLGMGTNMYPSSALLGENKDVAISSLPVDDLIENADGFAGVFPGRHIFVMVCEIGKFVLYSIFWFGAFVKSISTRLWNDYKLENT